MKLRNIPLYLFGAGLVIMLLSLLLMSGFAAYDLFFSQPSAGFADLMRNLTPTWRADMFVLGLLLISMAFLIELPCKVMDARCPRP